MFFGPFQATSGRKEATIQKLLIYFSSDPKEYETQQRNRFPPEPAATELPPDAQAIIILVELIHHPEMNIDELTLQLQKKGHTIEAGSIAALFRLYRIDKKKLNTRL